MRGAGSGPAAHIVDELFLIASPGDSTFHGDATGVSARLGGRLAQHSYCLIELWSGSGHGEPTIGEPARAAIVSGAARGSPRHVLERRAAAHPATGDRRRTLEEILATAARRRPGQCVRAESPRG